MIWWVMVTAGLLTFLIRLSFIVLWGKIKMPDLFYRSLQYVPPAVLAAIILPEMFIQDNQIEISLENFRLFAGIVAIVVAWKTRNAILTIIAGMSALYLLQYFLK